MPWASVATIRSMVYTVEEDSKIESILSEAQGEIESIVGTQTATVPPNLGIAHKYLAAATLMDYMITSGELAYFNKMADTQTYNKVQETIERHMSKYEMHMRKYGVNNATGSLYHVVKYGGE